MQDRGIIDQTRPDHPSALKSLRQFIRAKSSPRVLYMYYRCKLVLCYLIFWRIEYVFSRIFRPKKRALILQNRHAMGGLMCILKEVLGGIAYADRKNMIPVVDMRTYPNSYLSSDEVSNVNAWEYYFAQPAGISLDEALSMNNCITEDRFCDLIHPDQRKYFFDNSLGQLTYWRKIARKYIRFTPPVTERLECMKAKYQGMRILGVRLRGTDYVTTTPKNHPVQPTAEQAIAKAREAMSGKNFDAVYLATEDKRIVAKFQEAFGDRLILPEAQYVDYDYSDHTAIKNWLYNYSTGRPNDKYLIGLEYLVTILFLCRCEGLITSINNGSVMAMLFSDGFEYFYFFDLGVY